MDHAACRGVGFAQVLAFGEAAGIIRGAPRFDRYGHAQFAAALGVDPFV
jgi:hypothetical protein